MPRRIADFDADLFLAVTLNTENQNESASQIDSFNDHFNQQTSMNFIAKKIHWIGILLLVGFTTVAAGLYFDVPGKIQKPKPAAARSANYVCPMHPDLVSAKPGDCPKCGMALVAATEMSKIPEAHAGCGTVASAEMDGCCEGKASAELTLPPGHPPVEGYKVQSGCDHSSGAATNAAK